MIRRSVILAGFVLLAALSAVSSTAFAYWTASGTGTGSATTGTLEAPTGVDAVFSPGLGTVQVSWTASAGSLVPQGYYVTRTDEGNGLTAAACGSSPTTLVASPCTDSPLVGSTYHYTVTAVYESWTATGVDSDSVVVTLDTTAPTVVSIDRAGASAAVNAGPLSWTVTFSEPVSGVSAGAFSFATSGITGSPSITGVEPSGSAPSATWTVQASVGGVEGSDSGSISLDLVDAVGIEDAVGNTLSPSTFAGQAYTYDTTAPTVIGVSSTLADGAYAAGTEIPVTVTFSEPVTVVGTPELTLATGSPGTTVVGYSSGSGDTLTFTYTVAAGDTSADLDYASASSLALGGATIRDAVANDADVALPAPGEAGSLGASRDLVIDTTAPVVTVSHVNGSPQTLPYATPLDVTSVGGTCGAAPGDAASVEVLVDGASAGNATCDSGSWEFATSWTIVGTRLVSASQDDAAGNTGFALEQAVTVEPPTVVSIVRASAAPAVNAGPLSWTVTFTEPVSGVASGGFGLVASGVTGSPLISGVAPSGVAPSTTWTVQASVAGVAGSDAGSIGLDLVDAAGIGDPAGNPLSTASFVGEAYTYDTTLPTVIGVSSALADGAYTVDTVVPVTVTFSEPVTVLGNPQLTLVTGSPATTQVGYSSGTGTDTLTFEYTVVAGDTSADLAYEAATSLVGDIRDAAGNAAVLALPVPGSAGSLSGGKALVIDTTAPVVTVTDITISNGQPRVRVSGTGENLDGPVTVYICNNVSGPCVEGSATDTITGTAVSKGKWRTAWSARGTAGTWSAFATQEDAAGNIGSSVVFGPIP